MYPDKFILYLLPNNINELNAKELENNITKYIEK